LYFWKEVREGTFTPQGGTELSTGLPFITGVKSRMTTESVASRFRKIQLKYSYNSNATSVKKHLSKK